MLGIDLVQAQLAVADGATLGSLGLAQGYIPKPRGYAIQLRVNMEVMDESGATKPTGGTLSMFDLPSGPGVRVDTFGYSGYKTSAAFELAAGKSDRAFAGRRLARRGAEGAARACANSGSAASPPTFRSSAPSWRIRILPPTMSAPVSSMRMRPNWSKAANENTAETMLAEAGSAAENGAPAAEVSTTGPAGSVAVPAPLQGTIVAIEVREGDLVRPGQQIAVLESMKMEHLVTAPHGGRVTKITAGPGVTLMQDEAILYLEPAEIDAHDAVEEETVDLDHIRPDLAELIARHAITLDENRPASVERRRKTNQRTARENVAQLVDEGSFVEYGSLAIAAQRRRRKVDDLIMNTPADGLISGVATVNAEKFGA